MARKILHLTGWLIYFGLSAFYKINNFSLEFAFQHTIFVVGLAMLMFYGFGKLVNQFFEKEKYVFFAIGSVLFFFFFFMIKLQVEGQFFPEFYDLSAFDNGKKIKGFVAFSVLATIVFSGLIHLLENRFEKEKRDQALINQHNEAQLQFLKAQINPHFLFNTLNNIYSLSMTGSKQTSEMILKLADLLRYVIYESKNEKVLLQKEVAQIKKYIELFQMKSEHPLNVKFEVQGDLNNAMIEPMILIPLVENCFKHCDFETNENAFAKINLEIKKDQLFFQTQNTKSEIEWQKDKVGGVGLENIKKRLELNYPNQHDFKIKNDADFFEVKLKLNPIKNK